MKSIDRTKEAMKALARIEARVVAMSDDELDYVEDRGVDVFFRTYVRILVCDEKIRRAALTSHQRIGEFRKRNRNQSGG